MLQRAGGSGSSSRSGARRTDLADTQLHDDVRRRRERLAAHAEPQRPRAQRVVDELGDAPGVGGDVAREAAREGAGAGRAGPVQVERAVGGRVEKVDDVVVVPER